MHQLARNALAGNYDDYDNNNYDDNNGIGGIMPHDSLTGCDLLIWAESPTKTPLTTGRCRGQVINIMDCPHKGWGREEKPTGEYRMKVLHMADKRRADLAYLLEVHQEFHDNDEQEDSLGFPQDEKAFVRRKKRIAVDTLDMADQTAVTVNTDRYHTMTSAAVEASVVDDSNHPVLKETYPKPDRTDDKKRVVALIRRGEMEPPPNWDPNLFKDLDTTDEEAAIIAARAVELGR
jgi:hypothetical protein